MSKLVIGWYGVGKTTYINSHKEVDIVDLQGYPDLKKIEELEHHNIVVADPDWALAFVAHQKPFNVVVPNPSRKKEFLENISKRKNGGMSNPIFTRRLDRDWTPRLKMLVNLPNTNVITLEDGQFFGDIIEKLI